MAKLKDPKCFHNKKKSYKTGKTLESHLTSPQQN